MKPQVREADMRSLDRRSMYSIFAPLDANEPLPRQLLDEARRYRLFGGEVPLEEDAAGRRELAGLLWLPALGLMWSLTAWAHLNVILAIGAVVMLFVAIWMFAGSGSRKWR